MVGIYMSMTAIAAWIYTVKEVDSSCDSFQNISRSTYSHQIGRFVLRKVRHDFVQNMIHLLMSFPNCKTANCVAVQIQFGNGICMRNTILSLCKSTDCQQKKQTCENKSIYSPHSLIQPGYWKSQLRQPSLIRTYVLFCFLMIQSCSSSSRLRDSTIDFKA